MTSLTDPKEYREKVFAWAEARGIKTVRLVIIQPRVHDEPTEYQMPLAELEDFAEKLHKGIDRCRRAEAAIEVMPREKWAEQYLLKDPHDGVCRWCKAQPTCPSVQRKLQEAAQVDFQAVVEEADAVTPANYSAVSLEGAMRVVPLMESWCKSVRAEVERRLLAGEEMTHFGLELGRLGNRQWTDPAEAQTLLRKQMRLRIEDVFEFSLKSPTQIEKLVKPGVDEQGKPTDPVIGVRQWGRIEKLIVRAEPKPSVKPKAAIKTPYIVEKPTAEGFMPVEEPVDDDDLSA